MNYLDRISDYFAGTYHIRLLLYTLFGLVVSDGLISTFLVTQGLGYEGNPFLLSVVTKEYFLLLKVFGVSFSALALLLIYKRYSKISLIVIVSFVILYTIIVYWNVFVSLVTFF
jgi:hypothetical protein